MRGLAVFLLSWIILGAARGERISVPPPADMTRAEIVVAAAPLHPKAILILCPGMNGDAGKEVEKPTWQTFARENQLGLVGLSFASSPGDLARDKGYTSANLGSGVALQEALRSRFPSGTPLLLYGFSSGAYFVESFVQSFPDQVAAWCAHATGRYEVTPTRWPPGIVSCGELDGDRYGSALTHFKKGRAAGNRLLWVSLASTGHAVPPGLDDFVRAYFSAVLAGGPSPAWVDIDTKKIVSRAASDHQPTLTGWLPSAQLFPLWFQLHQP